MAFPTKILLATDGSKDADMAARAAVDLANQPGAELHVVYVGQAPPYPAPEHYEVVARQRLDELVEEVTGAGGNVAEAHLRMEPRAGKEDEHIVGLAEELGVDLIVVGSRGLSGIKHALVGSVSESVVRHAHCPVLVMRH
jgi:nucleotide-binding universal stress UspA family protein